MRFLPGRGNYCAALDDMMVGPGIRLPGGEWGSRIVCGRTTAVTRLIDVGHHVGHDVGLARTSQFKLQRADRSFVEMEVIQVKLGQQVLP